MSFIPNMRILPINNTNTYFRARNSRIRQADDIQRRARREFPALSSTYIDKFYTIAQTSNHDIYKRHKADTYSQIIDEKIADMREATDKVETAADLYIPYSKVLNHVKKIRAGNCAECSASVVAALAANGIYDSEISNLGLLIEFKNKKTGKSEFESIVPIDHSFVVTALNNRKPKEKDKIVIDSWFGFTDSISGAKGRYKPIYNENSFEADIAEKMAIFKL